MDDIRPESVVDIKSESLVGMLRSTHFHGAVLTVLRIKVLENVCLVCHMHDGKFDRIHEYVDTSQSFLIGLGLKLLPQIVKVNQFKKKIQRK